jgi:hypothetical protein
MMMTDKETLAEKLDDLKRVEGVSAVPPGPPGTVENGPGRAPQAVLMLPRDDVDNFTRAGWAFVESTSRVNQTGARPVFKDSDGHLKIDSGNLNVRFAGEASVPEIESLLKDHGLLIRRQLGFAPNLYTVGPSQADAVTDSVEIAKLLTTSQKVEYAEPVLIEALGGRNLAR